MNISDTNYAQNNRFPPPSISGGEIEIDFRKFLVMLWRRKFMILFIMLFFVGGVAVYINSVQPRYTAKSSVLIENSSNPGGELRAFISSMRIDTTVILSEAEVFKSRTLARKIIDRLDLMNDPELNPALRAPESNLLRKILNKNSVSSLITSDDATHPITNKNFKQLSVYKQEMIGIQKDAVSHDMGIVIDNFLENMRVRPVPGSFVLQVEFNSVDPVKAALIANVIVDTYINQNLDMKFQTTEKLTKWLDQRLETLRTQVRTAEDAVQEFSAQHNLAANDLDDFEAQQLAGLNNQIVIAKAKEAEARARLKQINNWMKNPAKIKLTDEAEKSRVLQTLQLKEAETLNEISDLSLRYGDKYPKMVSAQLELEEIRDQIKQALSNIAKSIKADLKFAENRVHAIENSLGNTEYTDEDNGQANIKLRELVRESEASQAILDSFLQTYKRAADQDKLQESQARVISYATVPLLPYYPNKPLLLSLSVVVSCFLGIALALLLEKISPLYRTAEQLEEETGVPCLGIIPFIPKLDSGRPIADYVLGQSASRVAESVRTLRMILNLRAQSAGQKSKVVTVTSSLPEEGKTTLSAWMARTVAKSGERVIVLDCDLRRPRLHTAFGKSPQNTLVEYLTGKCTLEEAIFRDPGTNMHAIFGRSVPNNALDLITKDRMSNLLSALREQYDLIILDAPACLSVSDARLLASKSDQTIYAVSWDETPREVVNAGLKQFADFGYHALALTLTNVDLKRYSKYGFSDAVHYHSSYNPYYAD